MPRKKNETPIPAQPAQQILDLPMEEVMHNSMLPYAEHVIMERAVPRVEDGLKPVQRRILYTMNELAITPDTPHRKCARIVGDCLGKYHPHGDSSVYDALVRMAQNFSMRETLVDGHGNFGSVDGDGAAAMRYTEARMTPLAMEMLKDLDKNTVSFRLNFDDSLKEPDMLPASFPNLLVNGASGIAVGLATNIPTHNLREVIAATCALIDQPDIALEDLMQLVPGPDFPTGGILLRNGELAEAYRGGRGKLTLRARTHFEDLPGGKKLIVITEIPYQVNKSTMLERILHLSEEKKAALGCISDIRDESDRNGMRAVIELKKDADANKVLSYLYRYSDLQITFGVNMVAIADGKPRQLGLKRILSYYIRHRKNVVTARTRYDLEKARARAHILEGLMIAQANLDEVIALIRGSDTPKTAKLGLMQRFGLDDVQAQAVLDMRLQRLTNLEVLTLQKEYDDLQKKMAQFEAILNSEKKLLGVIKKELQAVAQQYGSDRRTEINDSEKVLQAAQHEAVLAEDALITYTRDGLIKRMYPPRARKQAEEESGEEAPLYRFETQTDHALFFFTNLGNCYRLGVNALPESKPRDRGALLSGVLAGLEQGEEPILIECLSPAEMAEHPDYLFLTSYGQIKRSTCTDYDVKRSKFAALTLREGDSLHTVLPMQANRDLLLITKIGQCIRFHADSIPVQGRTAGGVRAITLEDGDRLLYADQPQNSDTLLLMTERGYAKRVPYPDFEPQARAGKGVKCFYYNRNGSNGSELAAALTLQGDCNLCVTQAHSAPSVINSAAIAMQSKTDKGSSIVIALIDDVVTKVELLPDASSKAETQS